LLTSVFLIGGVLAMVGLIVGVVHLRRRTIARGMAWAGVSTSIVAVLIALGILSVVISAMRLSRSAGGGSGTGFDAWYGKPAPDFELTTLDGAPLRLSDFKGRYVILDFWATWERASVRKVPHLVKLQEEMPEELAVVGLSGEDAGLLRSFAAEHGINYHLVSSPRGVLPQPYSDIRRLPTTFFIDRDGVLRHVSVGYRDYSRLRSHVVEPVNRGAVAARQGR
jgi:peroxiredoxin